MIAGAGGRGLAVAQGPAGNTCCVAQGQDCTAAGCGGGAGALSYVGTGQGDYMQETTYRYVGYGGDFTRGRRDFTCIIISGSVLGLLVLIPLLLWLLAGAAEIYDCRAAPGFDPNNWAQEQKDYCCVRIGVGCATTQPVTAAPTPPPTPPPTMTLPNIRPNPAPAPPPGPVDPNCAVGQYFEWNQYKKEWCCRNHHICGRVTQPPAPADPYNCADGFANWQAGWSVNKKEWCCRVHGKGCPGSGGGCAPAPAPAPLPYDCNAGFANWVAGWSVHKKAWCCAHGGKGCPPQNGGCA